MAEPEQHPSRVRRVWSRMAPSREAQHAQEEQDEAALLGGTPLVTVSGRSRVTVCGTLRTVTLRPRGGVPALEADVYDGTGTLSVIWLGRRHIAGIEPGRRVRVTGMVAERDGRRVLYNPRYELVPARGD